MPPLKWAPKARLSLAIRKKREGRTGFPMRPFVRVQGAVATLRRRDTSPQEVRRESRSLLVSGPESRAQQPLQPPEPTSSAGR